MNLQRCHTLFENRQSLVDACCRIATKDAFADEKLYKLGKALFGDRTELREFPMKRSEFLAKLTK